MFVFTAFATVNVGQPNEVVPPAGPSGVGAAMVTTGAGVGVGVGVGVGAGVGVAVDSHPASATASSQTTSERATRCNTDILNIMQ